MLVTMPTKAPKLRPAAAVKPYAKKPRQNSAFKKHKISYSGKANNETPWGQHLKTIKQLPFEDILKTDQKRAKAFLTNTGVLSSEHKHLTFTCWACNQTIHRVKGEYRCQRKQCSSRSRITKPALVYSPAYMQASGGETPDFVGLVRVTYILGLKLENDTALHLIRRPNDTLDQARHKINRLFKAAKLALAFSEHELAKKTTFTQEIVEAATSRLSGKKVGSPKRTLSSGRTMCLVGRFARRWWVISLPPRLTRRGHGPKALREVKDAVIQVVDESTILVPDGAPAWAGSARAADIPRLAGGRRFSHQSINSRRRMSAGKYGSGSSERRRSRNARQCIPIGATSLLRVVTSSLSPSWAISKRPPEGLAMLAPTISGIR